MLLNTNLKKWNIKPYGNYFVYFNIISTKRRYNFNQSGINMHDYIMILSFHVLEMLSESKMVFFHIWTWIKTAYLPLCVNLNWPDCLEFILNGFCLVSWFQNGIKHQNRMKTDKVVKKNLGALKNKTDKSYGFGF